MRNILGFCCFMLFYSLGHAQLKDCKNFKSGLFRYDDLAETNTLIKRNDSIQIETNSVRGTQFEGSIVWLSDCVYELTYKKVSSPEYEFIIGKTITVQIISANESSYDFIAFDKSRQIKGKLVKIE